MAKLIIALALLVSLSGCGGDADYKPIDFSKTVPIAHPDTGTSAEKVLRVAVAAMISPKETFIYYRERRYPAACPYCKGSIYDTEFRL